MQFKLYKVLLTTNLLQGTHQYYLLLWCFRMRIPRTDHIKIRKFNVDTFIHFIIHIPNWYHLPLCGRQCLLHLFYWKWLLDASLSDMEFQKTMYKLIPEHAS